MNVYRNGTQVTSEVVNPAYASSYSISFTGTSGTETVVVTLNGQTYMEYEFNFDSQSTQVLRTYEFTPSGGGQSGGENTESSDSSTSEEGSSTNGEDGQ